MNLSTALRNIHADPFWWRKVLLGGACNLSVFGAPWSAGLVTESMDNVCKGFPSPLPPNIDPGTRYVIGLFSLVIDFFFFVVPLIVVGLLVVCAVAALAFGQANSLLTPTLATTIALLLTLVYQVAMFLLGAAPVGRLVYAKQGAIERALSAETLRVAFHPARRGAYIRARLQSLPAYLPFALLLAATWFSSGAVFPGSWLVTLVLVWFTLGALVYAHLVVAQLYGDAERLLG